MAFAKFQANRFRIDGEIAENQAILVNLTVIERQFGPSSSARLAIPEVVDRPC